MDISDVINIEKNFNQINFFDFTDTDLYDYILNKNGYTLEEYKKLRKKYNEITEK